VHQIEGRYGSLNGGRFSRKTKLDADLRPGELQHAIARAKAGDADAIRYIYLRFADNVYGYARSVVRDEHEAEDVTQQVFARLMTALASYEQRAVPFSAWLLRITHNLAIDHLRRQRAIPVEETPIVERREDGEEGLSLALREALAELPDGQREVVVLRHIAGWSPSEIAERLSRTEDAVHGLHHRGRQTLKRALVRRDAVPTTVAA
jgi:RNA polymerase sigma-70 factor, ECF subfamily